MASYHIDIAKTLHRLALADRTLENVGRLIISECRQTLNIPSLTGEAIIAALKEHYPKYDYDLRTQTCLLIYFDGKTALQTKRSHRPPYPIIANNFNADTSNLCRPEKHCAPEEIKAAKTDQQNIIWF